MMMTTNQLSNFNLNQLVSFANWKGNFEYIHWLSAVTEITRH